MKLLFGFDIIQEHGPLMVLGSLLFLAGLMMFSLGLIGEVMIRIYFESQGRRIYAIRDVLTQKRASRVEAEHAVKVMGGRAVPRHTEGGGASPAPAPAGSMKHKYGLE